MRTLTVRICDIHFKFKNGTRIGHRCDHRDRGGICHCGRSDYHISDAFFAYVAAGSELGFGLPKAIRWEGRGHHR